MLSLTSLLLSSSPDLTVYPCLSLVEEATISSTGSNARTVQMSQRLFQKMTNFEDDSNPSAKFSEISAMRYLWDSQEHYPQIPVPKIHVWDLSFNNPVGAPYVLMEVARGVSLNLRATDGRRGLDSMTFADQLTIVNTLANIQASLSKPVSFNRIGSIYILICKGKICRRRVD